MSGLQGIQAATKAVSLLEQPTGVGLAVESVDVGDLSPGPGALLVDFLLVMLR